MSGLVTRCCVAARAAAHDEQRGHHGRAAGGRAPLRAAERGGARLEVGVAVVMIVYAVVTMVMLQVDAGPRRHPRHSPADRVHHDAGDSALAGRQGEVSHTLSGHNLCLL